MDFTYMKNFKLIFTWWNRQTFGTFLKTIFFGKLIGKDDQGNKYYKSKKDERWVIYKGDVEATKITSDWYLWIHRTIDKPPLVDEKKFSWQKKHQENKTGTKDKYIPTKIEKKIINKKYETWK